MVSDFPNDARPNVVLKVEDHFVIYGHVNRSSTIQVGDEVSPNDEVGRLVRQGSSNHHLHLSIRIGSRSFNPLYFFDRDLVELLEWGKYAGNENAWSMKSFLYVATSTANYWVNPSDAKLGIER